MTRKTRPGKTVNAILTVHGFFLLGTLATLIALISGCGEKRFGAVRDGIDSRGHYIEGVPFVKQTGNDCGPAALAGVLAFHGRPADLEKITVAIYLPKLRGTLPMDLERFAKDAGFKTASSAGTADTLKAAIRSNIPVICLLDLGFGPYRQPHYVTVIGFDDENGLFIMHDGGTPDRTMAYEKFEKAWTRAGTWMIVIKP